MDRHVSGAGELGGRRARCGVRNHAPGHRPVGRESKLHARGHVVDGQRVASRSPGSGLRETDEDLPVERFHGWASHESGAVRLRIHVRHAGNTGHTGRQRPLVRRGRHGVAALGVHVRAARQTRRAGRLRGPVAAGQLDAGGHWRPRPPVVPGRAARRPADTRHVWPTAGQRTGVRAHRTNPVVQRRGTRPPVAGAPAHHGVRQHASLSRTESADGAKRPRNRRHTPEPAARTASPSKCHFIHTSRSDTKTRVEK